MQMAKSFFICQVDSARNLAGRDRFNTISDPYVKIDLVAVDDEEVIDSVRTETKNRTLNPMWNEEFLFRVKLRKQKLILKVFDEDMLTDDFLGR